MLGTAPASGGKGEGERGRERERERREERREEGRKGEVDIKKKREREWLMQNERGADALSPPFSSLLHP